MCTESLPFDLVVLTRINVDHWLRADPVFLGSACGALGTSAPSETALGPDDVDDRRLSSISASVDWARSNNILGIFMDADLLVRLQSRSIWVYLC